MVEDILLDNTGDLQFKNGDFDIGLSDEQHVILIVNTMPGSFKQFPLLGVGIIQYSASSGQSATLRRSINIQLNSDGYTNIDVALKENGETFMYNVSAERLL